MKLLLSTGTILLMLSFSCRTAQPGTALIVDNAPGMVDPSAPAFDSQSFAWFWELLVEGVDLPPELIREHTLISQPFGSYQGQSLWAVNDQIQAAILQQKSSLCTTYFLLTSDGNHIIDQRLIGENCQSGPASESHIYTRYQFLEVDEIQVQEIHETASLNSTLAQSGLAFRYRITGEGQLQRCLE